MSRKALPRRNSQLSSSVFFHRRSYFLDHIYIRKSHSQATWLIHSPQSRGKEFEIFEKETHSLVHIPATPVVFEGKRARPD